MDTTRATLQFTFHYDRADPKSTADLSDLLIQMAQLIKHDNPEFAQFGGTPTMNNPNQDQRRYIVLDGLGDYVTECNTEDDAERLVDKNVGWRYIMGNQADITPEQALGELAACLNSPREISGADFIELACNVLPRAGYPVFEE